MTLIEDTGVNLKFFFLLKVDGAHPRIDANMHMYPQGSSSMHELWGKKNKLYRHY